MPSEIYRLICIVDSFQNGDQTPSVIDASPNYLHIHILKSTQLQTIEEFSSKLSDKPENEILFQWGIPLEKDAKTRSEKVSTAKVRQFGNIGLGSAARGRGEQTTNFIGGGEAFLFDDQNFRITKGNTAFEAKDEQTYWTFQVADFNGAKKIDDLNGLTIEGRNQLMHILKEKSKGKPFVAVFDAQFEENLFARSNGIFPEDLSRVTDSKQSLFMGNIMGGHLVGGSTNQGDIDSLRQEFLESEAGKIDFTLTIKSEVILKPIGELQIAKLDGSFRKPRTTIEVENAAQVIQKHWRDKTDGRQS
jgi:hypothetical protein